jgi:16S rRNA (guanine527-N7)-methyltransferase
VSNTPPSRRGAGHAAPAPAAAAAPAGALAGQLAPLAAEMDVALDHAQCAALEQFARLLLRWNRVHNLTAITADSQVLTHHLLDSLSIVAPLRELSRQPPPALAAQPQPVRVLDVGAGAGLPGIALAIALPQLRFTLNDAVSKKCAFMTQARLELGLTNVEVIHGRAEQLRAGPFDLIVSRALATLAVFTTLTRHLLAPGGRWLAMKGAEPLQELRELPPHVKTLQTVKLRVPRLDEARHLVVLAPDG